MAVELPVREFAADTFICTGLGNKISKAAHVHGSQYIVLAGNVTLMEGVVVRGDLAQINMGSFCHIGARAVIRPPFKHVSTGITYFPARFLSRVVVGEDSVVDAIEVGNHVLIGRNVLIGQSSVIKDCCFIQDGSVLPPDSVIGPFSIVAGNPARVVGRMPINTPELMADHTSELYYKVVLKARV